MSPLPKGHVMSLRAFAYCGVDYAGPFKTKITRCISAKRYLCLFTCLATRAVHLEMAYSLTTARFLNAFSRRTAGQGVPEFMVSDNAGNFVLAEKELRQLVEAMDRKEIRDPMAVQPLTRSHHSGVFESLIKSAKRAIYAILSSVLVNEELETAFHKVEGFLNSHPLSYASSDPADETPIIPNHFLISQIGGPLAPRVVDDITFHQQPLAYGAGSGHESLDTLESRVPDLSTAETKVDCGASQHRRTEMKGEVYGRWDISQRSSRDLMVLLEW